MPQNTRHSAALPKCNSPPHANHHRITDEIALHYEEANRDYLIQRLLLKKWAILNEIEQFLIHISENYADNAHETPTNHRTDTTLATGTTNRAIIDPTILTLLKHQHTLRTRGHHNMNILQTSKQVETLRTLSVNELNAILHDFDTVLCDIRQLIDSQHGALIFTTIPINETVEHLLKGYQTISQY